METRTAYDKETLLEIIESYAGMIERHNATGKKYPVAVLSDILASSKAVTEAARKESKR